MHFCAMQSKITVAADNIRKKYMLFAWHESAAFQSSCHIMFTSARHKYDNECHLRADLNRAQRVP